MKKISFLFLIFLSTNSVFSQFEKIKSFQRNLIDSEITASNVALVFKDGKVIYHNVENSMDPSTDTFRFAVVKKQITSRECQYKPPEQEER